MRCFSNYLGYKYPGRNEGTLLPKKAVLVPKKLSLKERKKFYLLREAYFQLSMPQAEWKESEILGLWVVSGNFNQA